MAPKHTRPNAGAWAIASAILKFKPHFYPQNTLELDAKGFEIKGISMLDAAGEYGDLTGEEIAGKVKKKLEFTYDKRKLTIKLGQEYTRKDTLFVKIDYVAKPNDVPRGKEDDSASDKGLYFINADGLDEGKPRQVRTQ